MHHLIHPAKTPQLMVFLGAMAECFFILSLAFLPDFDHYSLNGRRPATVLCKLIFPLHSPSATSLIQPFLPPVSGTHQLLSSLPLCLSLSCFSLLTIVNVKLLSTEDN